MEITRILIALVVHEFLEVGFLGLSRAAGAAAAIFLTALIQTAQLSLGRVCHIAVVGSNIFIAGEAPLADGTESILTLLASEAPLVAKQNAQELKEHKDHGQHNEGAPAAAAVQVLSVVQHLVLGFLSLRLVMCGKHQAIELELSTVACTHVKTQAHARDFLCQHLLQNLAAHKGRAHGHDGHKDHGCNRDRILRVCANAVDELCVDGQGVIHALRFGQCDLFSEQVAFAARIQPAASSLLDLSRTVQLMTGEMRQRHQQHGNQEGNAQRTHLLGVLTGTGDGVARQHIAETHGFHKHQQGGQQPDENGRAAAAQIASLGEIADFFIEVMLIAQLNELLVVAA